MYNLTCSLEDYLEALYILQENNKDIRITDVANHMRISKPSVKRAVNSLKKKSMVEQQRYGKVSLTPLGKEIGQKVYSRHKILTDFFTKILKVSSQNAEPDACRSEHILSEETIDKIIAFTQKQNNIQE